MKANLDESVTIKEIDQFAIHVKLTKISVSPKDPLHPSTSTVVKCFPVKTFEIMEAMRYARNPIVWYRAGGFDEARIVHDGRLESKEETPVAKAEGESSNAKKLAEERRKKQRIENLALARAKKQLENQSKGQD
jgi:hypothetical protein